MLAVKNLYFWEEYTEVIAQCGSNGDGITVVIFKESEGKAVGRAS